MDCCFEALRIKSLCECCDFCVRIQIEYRVARRFNLGSANVIRAVCDLSLQVAEFNDIIVSSVTMSYTLTDGVTPYGAGGIFLVPLSATIPANSTGSIVFAPIGFDELFAGGDNTTINVSIAFSAITVAGQTVNIAGGTGAQLFIEDCLP